MPWKQVEFLGQMAKEILKLFIKYHQINLETLFNLYSHLHAINYTTANTAHGINILKPFLNKQN